MYTVPQTARLRLVYIRTGRQELWVGPASFTIGQSESVMQSGTSPTVTQLPIAGAQAIRRVPKLLRLAGSMGRGARRVRGQKSKDATINGTGEWRTVADLNTAERAELEASEHSFRKLRASLAKDDPTPDYMLVSTLSLLRLKAELLRALIEAERRFPKETTLTELRLWVEHP